MAEVDPEPIDGEAKIEEGDKQGAAQPRKHDEQHAAALDKVTDYVEEQLITGDTSHWEGNTVITWATSDCTCGGMQHIYIEHNV